MLGRWNPSGALAIVTGASSGIGFALSRLLYQRGATVIATARRAERLAQLAEACGEARAADEACPAGQRETPTAERRRRQCGRIVPVVGDITDAAVRDELVQRAAANGQGGLDLLVNNAGVGALGPFADASPQRLRLLMEVNFFAPVELARSCLPLLRRGRRPVICNIGSVLGHRAVPDKSEYCASKFALHGWSDAVRAEWAGDGIQVTLVSPSTTSSEFFQSVVETDVDRHSRSIGSWHPDRVARATLAAIAARRAEVILSLGGKALVYADRLAPPLVNRLLIPKQR